MIKNLESYINLLHSNKTLITELFEKRDIDVFITDVIDDINVDFELLYKLRDSGLIELGESNVYLNDTFVQLFEELLGTDREIRIKDIAENLDHLTHIIGIYRDENQKHLQSKSIRDIKKYLKRINKSLINTFQIINERVILEYQNQSDHYTKLKELNRYSQKIDELIDAEKQIHKFLKIELKLLQNIPDSELRIIIKDTTQTLRGLRTSFVELQMKVTEYIHKFDERTSFVEKIFKIKELIKNHELKTKTNFIQLLRTTPTALIHNKKRERFDTKISTEIIYEFDFRDKVKLLNNKISYETKLKVKAPKIEFIEDETEESDAINLYTLFDEFNDSNVDLFSFIEHKEFETLLELEDKIELFLKVISEFDSELDIEDSHISKQEYEIAKVYMRKDY
ncbi:MAG: hypothetical protein U9P72_03260 [Campylobacterota bacterium]|nr:hypothetical protein [Campylobacterota bacterium]